MYLEITCYFLLGIKLHTICKKKIAINYTSASSKLLGTNTTVDTAKDQFDMKK